MQSKVIHFRHVKIAQQNMHNEQYIRLVFGDVDSVLCPYTGFIVFVKIYKNVEIETF